MAMGISVNEMGQSAFENLQERSYILKVSAIGYEDFIEKILISNTDTLFLIQLEPKTQKLKEVVVSGKKPLFEQKSGMLVMNVQERAISTENNTLELLRKMLGVSIDSKGQISLYGHGVSVTMDNKPTYLSGDDLVNMLKSLPPEQVSKIETKSNPSSEYDAEGVGGVINIQTLKSQRPGFNGSIYAGAGYSGSFKHTEGFNVNFRSKKVYLQASLGYNHDVSKDGGKGETFFVDGSKQTINTGESDNTPKYTGKSSGGNLYWRFGADYYINSYNTIKLSFKQSNGQGDYKTVYNSRSIYQDVVKIVLKSKIIPTKKGLVIL